MNQLILDQDYQYVFAETLKNQEEPENRRILVVDDQIAIHDDFRKIFSDKNKEPSELDRQTEKFFGPVSKPRKKVFGFEFEFAGQGEMGVELVRNATAANKPFALAFVDMDMPPGIDGIEATKRIWQIDPNIQVVLCTASPSHTLEAALDGFRSTDRLLILKKPYDPLELTMLAASMIDKWNLSRAANKFVKQQHETIDNAHRALGVLQDCHSKLQNDCRVLQKLSNQLQDRIHQQSIELLGMKEVAFLALAQLAESRDPETGDHLHRMQAFSQMLAERLAVEGPYASQIDDDFLEDIWQSAPLHDIGKVGIPDEILLKPGALTDDEFEVMKTHTTIGADVLETASRRRGCGRFLSMAIGIARHHHERMDGTGYPNGLAGEDIPLAARIVSVADVFDALTSKRVYKEAMDIKEAQELIRAGGGTQFDPHVVEAFCEIYDDLVALKQTVDSVGINTSPTTPTPTPVPVLDNLNVHGPIQNFVEP